MTGLTGYDRVSEARTGEVSTLAYIGTGRSGRALPGVGGYVDLVRVLGT